MAAKLTGERILELAYKARLWRPMVVPCRTGKIRSWLLSFGEMQRRTVIEIFAIDDAEKKIQRYATVTA